MAEETPLMKQYNAVKQQHPDALLFFRLGDFYEMFGDDAKEASQILGVTLTARQGTPMCGVPHHSSAAYINKAIKAGKKVAVCEQVGSVSTGGKTKLFERKVVRVITPGTVVEDSMLDSGSSNYIVCLMTQKRGWALACLDVSTGEFWVNQEDNDEHFLRLSSVLASVNPSEIVTDRFGKEELNAKMFLPAGITLNVITPVKDAPLPAGWPGAKEWEDKTLALSCAQSLLEYINVNDGSFKDLFIPFYKEISDYMQLDEAAAETLDLINSPGGKKGSLWGMLDVCKTPMGSRMLKNWLLNPLLDPEKIKQRQDCVQGLFEDGCASAELQEILGSIGDIERMMSRTATGTASPRDLAGIKASLKNASALKEWVARHGAKAPHAAAKLNKVFPVAEQMSALLNAAVEDAPPMKLSDGGVIKEGYSAELDELRSIKNNSSRTLADLAERERAATGISTLKVGFNSVFGYYIEVSKMQAAKVPYNYTRKQTLANAERFITEELKSLEDKILHAQERILRVETYVVDEVRKALSSNIETLRSYAAAAAELDVYLALAYSAREYNFTRPRVTAQGGIAARGGRHPIVERTLPSGSFVPNDINLGGDTQIAVITGPNMGGKSVYLKQTALLVILAQAGSFVPAAEAALGITDKILTRIGAHDALFRGDSTFMVEMKETAHILAGATGRSLVLLDEVGRGTSTYDGVSIAWAITEFLYKPHTGARVLFATHYFELTDLAAKYPGIQNFHVEAREYTDAAGKSRLAFLYQIKEGAADKSYGIHVAELAGLPQAVIVSAKKVMKNLETKKTSGLNKKADSAVEDLFSNPIVEEIRLVEPQKMTPLEALQMIADWKERLK